MSILSPKALSAYPNASTKFNLFDGRLTTITFDGHCIIRVRTSRHLVVGSPMTEVDIAGATPQSTLIGKVKHRAASSLRAANSIHDEIAATICEGVEDIVFRGGGVSVVGTVKYAMGLFERSRTVAGVVLNESFGLRTVDGYVSFTSFDR